MSHLKDIMGERAANSLLQYAASEAALDQWSRGQGPVNAEDAFAAIEASIGARVGFVSSTPERLVVTVDSRTVLKERTDKATADALLVGFLQGIHRKQTGQFPEVVFSKNDEAIS